MTGAREDAGASGMTPQQAPWTAGPWHVGAQNDALFIVAGRSPALNNDHPWHDAPRVAIAKVYGPTEGDCLPVDAEANGKLLAAAPQMAEALIKMDALVVEMQRVATDYLSRAGSEHRPQDWLNSLIALLDGPQQRDSQALTTAALTAAGARP